MKILALDPGSERSALVRFNCKTLELERGWMMPNDEMREWITGLAAEWLIIEITKPYTLQTRAGHHYVPEQVQRTAFEAGRFAQCSCAKFEIIDRHDVKKWLLGRATGDDKAVRDALLDRFGGRDRAIGGKKCSLCKGTGQHGRVYDKCGQCFGDGWVEGKRSQRKKCPNCSGKGVRLGGKATCTQCNNSKWDIPPGPLSEVTADLWAALAVAVAWNDRRLWKERLTPPAPEPAATVCN